MNTKLFAFHGDKKIKAKYLARIRAHRKADRLVQGVAWENGKGCAVGCTLEKYEHKAYEVELGIPEMLARLEDCIFEGLERDKAMLWPDRFLKAIKPGADLSLVGVKFLIEINKRNLSRLDPGQQELLRGPIGQVVEVLEGWIKTGSPNESAARSAAWSAESAALSAESAAWSAESAAEYVWTADLLVNLLKGVK